MASREDIEFEQKRIDLAHEQRDAELDKLKTLSGTDAGADRNAQKVAKKLFADGIAALTAESPALVLGRMNAYDQTWYVGRCHLECSDLEVVNWRADIAAAYFQATKADPHGLVSRRSFRLGRDLRTLQDFAEDVFDPIAHRSFEPPADQSPRRSDTSSDSADLTVEPPVVVDGDDEDGEPELPVVAGARELEVEFPDLRAADLLLTELRRERSGEMQDIVATIQAEQDRVVRRPLGGVLVVQGGPGTGKTAVGLHRASYLLYSYSAELGSDPVLVAGPNVAFLAYIRNVLPSLGDSNVVLRSFSQVALAALPAGVERTIKVAHVDSYEASRLKGDIRMAEVLRRAVHQAVLPDDDGISMPFGRFTLRVSAEQIRERIASRLAAGEPLRMIRADMLDRRRRAEPGWLADLLWDDYISRQNAWERSARDSDRRSFNERVAASNPVARRVEILVPLLDPVELLRGLYTDRDRLAAHSEGLLTDLERALLVREIRRNRRLAWSEGDLPLLAEVAALTDGVGATFGHAVVDEAQDLTPMQARMLARQVRRQSMTLLGDLAQASGPSAADLRDWSSITSHISATEATVTELTIGYRVPSEIMTLASAAHQPVAAGTTLPRAVRKDGSVIVERREVLADGLADVLAVLEDEPGITGIICTPTMLPAVRTVLASRGTPSAELPGEIGDSAVVLVPVDYAKGLEFDNVVVLEPRDVLVHSPNGRRLLFVALTRSTNRLFILHRDPLPAALGGEDPATDDGRTSTDSEAAPAESPATPIERAWMLAEIEQLRAENDALRRGASELQAEFDRRSAEVRRALSAAVTAVADAARVVKDTVALPAEQALDAAERTLAPWDDDDDARLRDALDNGVSPRRIAADLKRRPLSVLDRIRELGQRGSSEAPAESDATDGIDPSEEAAVATDTAGSSESGAGQLDDSLPTVEGSPNPPGWYPDPGGKHQLRHWDGTRWTDYVANNGATSTDPLS
jgi:DNA helicase IV